jgi:serine/threonine-protein kinase
MTPERWQHVERVYHEALAVAAEARGSFLGEACRDDSALRQEVESLLAHSSGSGILDRSSGAHLVPLAAGALVGRRVGIFEVLQLIGMGAMGEVYRARDTRLGRDVAIKILPPAFRNDESRVARFDREARVLGSLNHPHIAAIYGLEEEGAETALVMELVEGDDLSQWARSSVSDALDVARQIAEALEAAHEQGVVHRDLKPANVKVRSDGTVKVLDFGLAAVLTPASGEMPSPLATAAGALLGTPAYMSPEQARGEMAGRHGDIWAFGVVLYELLTGASPFARPTTAETLASVLGEQPDYARLPADTPAGVRTLIRRCLEKDRKRRLQHIGDARIELEESQSPAASDTPSRSSSGIHRGWLAAATPVIFLSGAAGWWLATRATHPPPASVVRLSLSEEAFILSPWGVRHLAISQDGARVAYASGSRLWIHQLDQQDAVVVDVSAVDPFFSPDGAWVGFFTPSGADAGLKKVAVTGGVPVILAATTERPAGASWGIDGTIVFATAGGLYLVPGDGGDVRLLAKPDAARRERGYAWPAWLPDQRSLLLTILRPDAITGAQIALLDTRTLESTIVMRGGTGPRYLPTGHVAYASANAIKVFAFDAGAKRAIGEPLRIADVAVATAADNGAADFAVSATGTLVAIAPTVPQARQPRTLSWLDRRGHESPLPVPPRPYAYPRISPDGNRVAVDVTGANRDIWVWNIPRSTLTQLTSGPSEDMSPLWSRDGRRVFFASDRTGNFDVYSQPADGAAADRVELAGPGFQTPQSFTPDGAALIVLEDYRDLGVLNMAQRGPVQPLLHSRAREQLVDVSPDGKWIAYESDESAGQFEIFLRPFPSAGTRREKVSLDGGRYPRWGSAASGELYYVDPTGAMMAAAITLAPTLTLGPVTKLFDFQKPTRGISGRPYDVSPLDGRFLVTRATAQPMAERVDVTVILNWYQDPKRRGADR